MDARKLALQATFDIVLCPYSLVTYMSLPGDLEALLSGARRVTGDGRIAGDRRVHPARDGQRQRLSARLPPASRREHAGAIQAGHRRSRRESIASSAATKSSTADGETARNDRHSRGYPHLRSGRTCARLGPLRICGSSGSGGTMAARLRTRPAVLHSRRTHCLTRPRCVTAPVRTSARAHLG